MIQGLGYGWPKGMRALLQEIKDELEMLQFLDGDGVQLPDAPVEVTIFFQVQRRGGGLALEVGVIHENGGEIGQHFRQPISRNFFAEQQHGAGVSARRMQPASGKRGHHVRNPADSKRTCPTR